MVRVFLDSNVIADWILLERKEIELTDELLEKRYRSMGYSYVLVNELLDRRIDAYISELCLAEVISVIYNEAVNRKLFLSGVPFSAWTWVSIRERFRLSEDEAEELYYGILETFDKLIEKGLQIVEDKLDLEVYSFLVLKISMDCHDAILLNTAIDWDVDYFITRDHRLLKKGRSKMFRENFRVKIVSPQAMLSNLGRKDR